MADSSRSPLDDSVFHPESATMPGVNASPFKPAAAGHAVAATYGLTAVAPARVEAEEVWFPSESAGDVEPFRRQDDTADAANGEPRRRRRDLSGLSRWALPILTLVVVLETGWLLSGFLRTLSGPAPAALPSASTLESPASASGIANGSGSVAGTLQAPADPVAAVALDRQPGIPSAPVAGGVQDVTGAGGAVSLLALEPGRVFIPLPFQVQVYEGGRFVGLNDTSLPLSPGSHQLQLVNDVLEFRVTERVAISSGRTTRLAPAVPSVLAQLNAVPWAEVTIDGTSIGETPLGNVPLSIGPHTIVFRHPQFGEQARSVVVTAQSPMRISVDLRN